MKQLELILPDTERESSELLKTLARLPFSLGVTTNYDRLMERALCDLAVNRPYRQIVQPIGGFNAARQKSLQQELSGYDGLILYKLHGTFSDEGADAKQRNTMPGWMNQLGEATAGEIVNRFASTFVRATKLAV